MSCDSVHGTGTVKPRLFCFDCIVLHDCIWEKDIVPYFAWIQWTMKCWSASITTVEGHFRRITTYCELVWACKTQNCQSPPGSPSILILIHIYTRLKKMNLSGGQAVIDSAPCLSSVWVTQSWVRKERRWHCIKSVRNKHRHFILTHKPYCYLQSGAPWKFITNTLTFGSFYLLRPSGKLTFSPDTLQLAVLSREQQWLRRQKYILGRSPLHGHFVVYPRTVESNHTILIVLDPQRTLNK